MSGKHIAEKWVDAYNRHDIDAMIDIYDVDIVNEQMPWGKSVRGRDAMRGVFLNVFQAFPDIKLEVINVIETRQHIVLEWKFGGTMKGNFAGHLPNDRCFTMRGCEIFRIENGKIREQRGYWDKATMFEQLKL